jgi:2-oxoglutarate ferredoxin oxidoreductase subunit alpha
MTATSGPGISLYSEHISFAIGSEIPLVIVNVQRLGPSTGSATRAADGDVQFMRWSNTGGLPAIVLAPVNAADCYTLTIEAFNLSERFRCPVFVASNKEIGLTRESLDFTALEKPELIERTAAPGGEPFLPFRPKTDSEVPYFMPIGGERLSRQTSSTHGENGYITTVPAEIAAQIERLDRKLVSSVDSYSFHVADLDDGAATLVLAYGVSARAARQAVREVRDQGRAVSLVILKTLWPVPEALIRQMARGHGRVLVVEMNLGLYTREIQRVLGGHQVEHVGRMDGVLIKPAKIKEVIGG